MSSASTSSPTRGRRYRTIDLVTIASLGVAFGVVFWAWGKLYGVIDLATTLGYPPAGGLLAGPWLIAGVVGGLIIRKPGAAFATELVAAIVSMFVLGGTEWGFTVLFSGVVQGLGAELVVLLLAYRRWTLPVAIGMGAVSGAFGAVYEAFFYYADWNVGYQLVYGVLFALSGAIVAGGLGWVLVRALAGTGALDAFPAGREADDRDAALT